MSKTKGTSWKTKYGARRVRHEGATVEEAIAAAQGLSDDSDEQVEIASSLIGLPQAIIFQIVLAAISPIIDLALIVSFATTWLAIEQHGWAQSQHSVEKMLAYWLVFTAIDLLSAVIAFALERREKWSLLWLLIPQRVGYRQIMYYVVLKAITQALRGPSVGWGKLQRTGRVTGGGS